MNSVSFGEYNKDQRTTYERIFNALRSLPLSEIAELKEKIKPYLTFRTAVDDFQSRHFLHTCDGQCFQTRLSACCGFESIIMFFADHLINALLSNEADIAALFQVLESPNRTSRCVYLDEKGCIWRVRPISCAMFLCDQARRDAFSDKPAVEAEWEKLKSWEKEFTWPVKPVLFDELEKYFIKLGVQSPHMFFHQSPGLLKLKARAGL